MRIGAPSKPGEPLDPDRLTVGEGTLARRLIATNGVALSSGQVRLAYFTARKSESVTQMRVPSGQTAAGATPTLVRFGVYSVAANGDLTLAGAIANDTTLFAAAATSYTRNLTASFEKVAGQRYAVGLIVVTAATPPTFYGASGIFFTEAGVAPRLTGLVSGQSDLPASVPAASVADGGSLIYSVLLP